MLSISDPKEVQRIIFEWKRDHKVGFVPTMGCLHEGHLSLVKEVKDRASKVVASIFVNPLQFGAGEDLDKYPRTFAQDSEKLEALGVDLLFCPTHVDLYPSGFQTKVMVGSLGKHLCGAARAGHFDGVATVCLKLFEITLPDYAVFGVKDFQQLRIIEQMVEDFNLPMEIIRGKIVREPDGLAMSSRNRYLNTEQRQLAGRIPEALKGIRDLCIANRSLTVGTVLEKLRADFADDRMLIDYLEVADSPTLKLVALNGVLSEIDFPRLFIAIKINSIRLIDNIALGNEAP